MITARSIEPGDVFARLTVDELARTDDGKRMWRCTCSCGKSTTVRGSDLVRGGVQSCGCLGAERSNGTRPRRDLTGHQLANGGVVLGLSEQFARRRNGDRIMLWHCRCACGSEFAARAWSIIGERRKYCTRKCPANPRNQRCTVTLLAPGASRAEIRAALKQPNGYKCIADEDKRLITLAAGRGDRDAGDLLVMMHENWVAHRVNAYICSHIHIGEIDRDELRQEARCALLEAASRWEPERGSFINYASWWLLSYMNKGDNSGRSAVSVPVNAHLNDSTRDDVVNARDIVSLDAQSDVDPDKTWLDVIDAAPEREADIDGMEALPAMLAQLRPKGRAVIESYFLQGKTLEQVGAALGVTKQAVHQVMVASLQRMKAFALAVCH